MYNICFPFRKHGWLTRWLVCWVALLFGRGWHFCWTHGVCFYAPRQSCSMLVVGPSGTLKWIWGNELHLNRSIFAYLLRLSSTNLVDKTRFLEVKPWTDTVLYLSTIKSPIKVTYISTDSYELTRICNFKNLLPLLF